MNLYVQEMEKAAGKSTALLKAVHPPLGEGPHSNLYMMKYHAHRAVEAGLREDLDEVEHHLQQVKLYHAASQLEKA